MKLQVLGVVSHANRHFMGVVLICGILTVSHVERHAQRVGIGGQSSYDG